ncbi:MAG: putative Ig domain-containing protein [Blastocatellia bacterium]
MHKTILRSLVTFACLLSAVQIASATSVIIPPDDDLIIGARAIVRAKVLSVSSSLDPQDQIYTYITLRVREVLKGHITDHRIVIKERGGQVGFQGTTIFGAPEFRPGEEVLLYLDTRNDGSLRVHQMFLGKFTIVADPQTGRRLVVRDGPDANVVVLNAQPHADHLRGAITDRMELSAYTRMIKRRLAANSERAVAFEQAHYTGVSVLASPPEYSRSEYSRSGRRFQPQFTFITNPPVRWFEPDDGEPVVFTVNMDGAPNPQVLDDITAAMNAWSNVAGCSLRVIAGGTGDVCYARDLNSMVFNNCDSQFSPTPFCAGVLAIGGVSWNASQTKVVNGTTFRAANTGHISFNPYAACVYDDHCQVREIATHELGHALGLGHSWNPCSTCGVPGEAQRDATMYGIAHFDGRCATLRQDDINGILFMYPATTGGPGPLAIVTESPLQLALIDKPYSQSLIAQGGAAPYNWAIVAGSGSLPSGLSISASGVISGTPTTEGTSNFTAQVIDANNNTVQKDFSITVTRAASEFNSQFITQTIPATLQPGQAFTVQMKFLNTGSKIWDGANGLYLRSQNPMQNGTWGGNIVPIFLPAVAPGQQLELIFIAFAPRDSGTYNFQWQLYDDSAGYFGQMSDNVSIIVGDGGSTPAISSASAVEAVKGQAFTFPLAASGGTTPYAWQVATGALPAGITLNPNSGLLAGTPAETGSFSFTVQVTDAGARKADKLMTMIVLSPPLDLMSVSLPNGQQGLQFNYQLVAAGGNPPYTWAIVSGALPVGVNLNPASGTVAGMPAAAGSFNFTIEVKDSESRTVRKALLLSIAPPSLSIETATLLEALKGSSFSYQPGAAGGKSPYTWAVASGTLPAGLSLNANTGLISGTPSATGTNAFAVTVRDQDGRTATGNVQIRVIDPETIPRITKVKYKTGKKLTVKGQRFDAAAVLVIDGTQAAAKLNDDQFVLKKLALSHGQHAIKVVNPGNAASQTYILTVN